MSRMLLSLLACAALPGESAFVQSDCDPFTDGTCRLWNCNAWRGKTFCWNAQCVCQPGYCANQGIASRLFNGSKCEADPRIPKNCEVDTKVECDGTIYKTPPARAGPSHCMLTANVVGWVSDSPKFTAVCTPGYCVQGDTCVRDTYWTCNRGTVGTCALLNCKDSRGPTECFAAACVCKEGFCANEDGSKCVPSDMTESVFESDLSVQHHAYANFLYQLTSIARFYSRTPKAWAVFFMAVTAMAAFRYGFWRSPAVSGTEYFLQE